MEYVIRGTGALGCFGHGKKALLRRIRQNDCLPLPPAAKTDVLDAFLPPARLRRTDHFSRLSLSAAFLALQDAGLEGGTCEDDGLLLASGYGPTDSTCAFKASFFDHGPLGASPTSFTKSVHNQAASHIAMQLNLRGPVTTICQLRRPFHMALLTACLWLAEKRVRRVLVGGVDERTPFLDYCRGRFAEERDGRMAAPFGPNPAEGAAFFVIEERQPEESGLAVSLPHMHVLQADEGVTMTDETLILRGSSRADASTRRHPAERIFSGDHLFGSFPAAAALDLALLTALPQAPQASCIEVNASAISRITLRQYH